MNHQYRNLRYGKEEAIGIITINRPESLNALNHELYLEIAGIFEQIAEDSQIKVVVLTGSGEKAFSAGADVIEMESMTPWQARNHAKVGKKALEKIESSDRPVIAAINGFALGGGCELAMACDIRIASESAKMGQPEINVGVIPGAGGTQRMTRLIGPAKAKELIFTGSIIDANEALHIGLVNRVFPSGSLMEEVMKLARKLASQPRIALSLAKMAINKGLEIDLNTALDYEIECFSQCFATHDQKEGMNAFMEKRKAHFIDQ